MRQAQICFKPTFYFYIIIIISDVHVCEHQSPCKNGAECVYDRDGEYSCLCLEGFHGKDCELKTGPCEKAG